MLHGKGPMVVLAIFVSILLLQFLRRHRDGGTAGSGLDSKSSQIAGAVSGVADRNGSLRTDLTIASSIVEMIKSAADNLKAAPSPAEKQRILQALLDSLKSNSHRQEVMAALVEYLRTNGDATTSLAFAPGPDGSLQTSPSLRVALLDLLGAIDHATAQQFAEEIFKSSNSPDEWAVALRDSGRGLHKSDEDRKTQFTDHLGQLLSREAWLRAPTAGFLHAFDAAVFVGGADMVRRMVSIYDSSYHSATSYAARLSLDRMAVADYRQVADAIQEGPNHLSREPATRAAILARGDPSDARDVKLMHDYLLKTSVSVEEKQVFLHSFPNGNLELSNNLLTSNPFIAMQTMAQRDDFAAKLLEEWSKEPAFDTFQDDIKSRLRALAEYKTARLGANQN